jgi:hypothetical protein
MTREKASVKGLNGFVSQQIPRFARDYAVLIENRGGWDAALPIGSAASHPP